jgi:hypothetical protein
MGCSPSAGLCRMPSTDFPRCARGRDASVRSGAARATENGENGQIAPAAKRLISSGEGKEFLDATSVDRLRRT